MQTFLITSIMPIKNKKRLSTLRIMALRSFGLNESKNSVLVWLRSEAFSDIVDSFFILVKWVSVESVEVAITALICRARIVVANINDDLTRALISSLRT